MTPLRLSATTTRRLLLACAFTLATLAGNAAETDGASSRVVQFIFTSDVHYGILRAKFQGQAAVDARVVNAVLVDKINALPATKLPHDDGLKSDQTIGAIDFLAIGGDIASRQEALPVQVQSASASWAQFTENFVERLSIVDGAGARTPLLLVPGNHDVSNAIGAPVRLNPPKDASSLVGIYNLTMKPVEALAAENFDYAKHRVQYSRDFPGLHCIFVSIWPDSLARAGMEEDLRSVPATTPVLIFCHDPPEVETRHLTNPNGKHDINSQDRFENVLADVCADGTTSDVPATIEQRALVALLKAHKNITAYFHGHSNWNEFYTWKGPDNDISLPTFRADSPMKGKVSSKEETKLSFQFVVYDPVSKEMTVRECLWNSTEEGNRSASPVAWGKSISINIKPPSS